MTPLIREITIRGNETFPNSPLPVLLYKRALNLPARNAAAAVAALFKENGWANNWKSGIAIYHHYHSNTHEAFACVKGATTLLLGGDNGKTIHFEAGDVIVIPAGVAHKNLGSENDAMCIGGYPEGKNYDMQYGNQGERPDTDLNIKNVSVPASDPIYGTGVNSLVHCWNFEAVPNR